MRKLGKSKGRKTVWDTAIDEEGVEVAGERIKLVWKAAYKKLGAKELDQKDFNEEFAKEVEKSVKKMESDSKKEQYEHTDDLSKDIELSEVSKIVKRLANGKAAGTDGIVNEVLKYGGETMYRVLWHICKKCFETEAVPNEWMKGIIFPIYTALHYRR
ncbi:MAG: hypothetical protein HRU26_07375 [Psychroserpens sp.]|nr:hypothetical protein [Psychroserpens sp.]